MLRAALVGAKREDLVIQARGDACGELVLEGIVLHPVARGYCSVPLPFLPGVKEQPGQQVTFAFEKLTDPSRQVFRVTEVTTQLRGEDFALSYWEVRGGKLVQLFGIEGMNGVSGAVTSYSSNHEVTPEKNGPFPRRLVVEESVARCGGLEEMPSGEQVRKEGCEKTGSRSILCYRNGQYTRCD